MLLKKKDEKLTILLLIALMITFLYVYVSTLINLAKGWYSSDDYSHGFLIIPICLYLIWRKKDRLCLNLREYSNVGLVVVTFSLCAFMASTITGIITLESLSLVLFIGGGIAFLLGMKNFKIMSFPIFFLLFMIPVPDQIYSAATIPLQLFVSKSSVLFLQLFDIPVLREGNVIEMPGHTLEVVQACSGLRSMISLFTLSLLFGYLTLRSNFLRGVVFLASVPIAILTNVIRVITMGVSFHSYNFDLTKGGAHTVVGLVLFIISLTLLYLLQRILSIWDNPLTAE